MAACYASMQPHLPWQHLQFGWLGCANCTCAGCTRGSSCRSGDPSGASIYRLCCCCCSAASAAAAAGVAAAATTAPADDWASCPCGHKGERATRRDLRKYSYLPIACEHAKQVRQQQQQQQQQQHCSEMSSELTCVSQEHTVDIVNAGCGTLASSSCQTGVQQ
jgi:hypothetical protein